ncbi:hypothetical protein MED222_00582 [Vibrio sp. MED222]|nr:hypothetical protein MED222_00582 [Vibrio sp. MED222]
MKDLLALLHVAFDALGGMRNQYQLGSDDQQLRSLSGREGHHAYQKPQLLLVRESFLGTMQLR